MKMEDRYPTLFYFTYLAMGYGQSRALNYIKSEGLDMHLMVEMFACSALEDMGNVNREAERAVLRAESKGWI